jgi:hypothetical protein
VLSLEFSQAASAKLQTLLEVDQVDESAHQRAPLLSMLTGVANEAHSEQASEAQCAMP